MHFSEHFTNTGGQRPSTILETALELNPASALTLHGQALVLTALGRATEAAHKQEYGLKADPFSLRDQYVMARLLVCLREYDRAAKHAHRAIELAPDAWMGRAALGLVYLRTGRVEEAVRELEEAGRSGPGGHYTAKGSEKTAVEVNRVGKDGLKTTEGTVSKIDRESKKLALKTADGTVETFKMAEHATKDAGKDVGDAAKKSAKVTGAQSGNRAHLVLAPEFDVRAVVTTHTGKFPVFAAPAAESSARVAREVLSHMPVRGRPIVIAGSSVPLPSRTPFRNAGVDRMISESRKHDGNHRLTVIIIGAATDTASALLVDPTLADRIEVVAFSGKEGGDFFNVRNDPIAWTVLLNSRTPITVGDGRVTKRDLSMTSERAHTILDPAGEFGRYLAGLLDQWLETHRDIVLGMTGDAKTWPVWDEVTVAYLLGMAHSEQLPRPKMRPDLGFDFPADSGFVTWVSTIDGDRLWADLARRVQAQR